jgi:tetratricopeptide (TPR) repeat protein/DNA-binding XRE family transcriptional regulator
MKNDRKSQLGPRARLRGARSEQGWSQQELADKLGTTKVNISRWENGITSPSTYFRGRLCETFGKTPIELGLLPPSAHGFRISDIPITRNPFFIGRESLLALLHKRLSTARAAALTQAQALYGLGGIGKTQTAAEYAFRYGDEYTHVFWVAAATRETIIADFVALAESLDLPEKEGRDQPRMVAAVKRWLASQEGWLLILDNADDLALAQEFLPRQHKGYILFTTRAQATGTIATSVEVVQLTQQDATLLLLRASKHLDTNAPLERAQAADRAAAESIVREMEGLPLALIQAGAYVEETGCTLSDYLSLYATHSKDLLARHSHLLVDYPKTVATTWSLSFQQVEQQSPEASDLLRFCAFLAPDAIPEEMLARGAAELGPTLGAIAGDSYKLNEALNVLRRYSLVRRNGSTHMLSIHRLVQTVLKESMDEETRRTWAEQTVRAVSASFPAAYSGTGSSPVPQAGFQQYYLPHVQHCAMLITQYRLFFPQSAQLLYQAATSLYVHGFYAESQSFHKLALAIRKQVFGVDHPTVAKSLNELAVLSRVQGDYQQAEEYHRQALSIREKVLGADDPAVAESLNNLSVLYRNQGKYEQAEPLLEQALRIRERSLGPEHPDTLLTLLNLGKLSIEQGRYEQAEQLLQQTLTTCERVLAPGHTYIAQNLNLLARLFYEQRGYEQARPLWERALAIIETAFGPEHPATAERLYDLAGLSLAQGYIREAQLQCQRALSICEKLLGSEHPDTIIVRELLTRILTKKEEEQDANQHPAPPTH